METEYAVLLNSGHLSFFASWKHFISDAFEVHFFSGLNFYPLSKTMIVYM